MWLGIRTYTFRPHSELNLPVDYGEYAPAPYSILCRMLWSVPRELRRGTLVDLGSGLGRILACASRLGFRRCVGIEIVPEMVEASRKNLARYTDCEIVMADAAEFKHSPEATVFFLSNPFFGEVLKSALRRVGESLEAAPRDHRILAFYNVKRVETAAKAVGLRLERIEYRDHGKGVTWASYRVAG